MKILEAEIIMSDTVLKYPEMEVTELAHELIRLAQPKLEIKLTEERLAQFVREASHAYVKSKSAWDAEEFTKLYVEMSTEKYFAIERANHSYNSMVLAYEAKVALLKLQLDKFKNPLNQ
jgi:hypothetical protein